MNRPFLVITIFLFSCSYALGQAEMKDWLKLIPLQYTDTLPEDISQKKSIAIVIANTRENGVALADKFHPSFVKSGIDPVSYYHVADLFTNQFVTEQFVKEFIKREIDYVVVLMHSPPEYELVITTFSANTSIINHDIKAWRMQHIELESIGRALYSQAYSLKRQNFLVVDQPEFQLPKTRLKGQRFEAYKPDLRKEILYIPLLAPISLDSTKEYAAQTIASINEYNNRNSETNSELKELFANYPYPYKFIVNNYSKEELMKMNIRYLLQVLHTTNGSVRTILNYKEKSTGVTEYITVSMKNGQGSIKRISTSTPVYKYYIKHIPSNSYYLGTKWDADINWNDALRNHIELLETEISP